MYYVRFAKGMRPAVQQYNDTPFEDIHTQLVRDMSWFLWALLIPSLEKWDR
jgi:hypothetical protein